MYTVQVSGTDGIRALPENTLLLYVGLPKTGTTALQAAAREHRAELLEQGVLYPGTWLNHRYAAFAVGGRHDGWGGDNSAAVPSIAHWDDLVAEIRGHRAGRVLVSHEFFAEFGEEICRRIVADLDRPVHVLFTLRSLPATLGSSWQQYLKTRQTQDFGSWLETVLDPAAREAAEPPRFVLRSDLSGHVEKWARVVGPENVTAIVLDPEHRELVADTVEALLGLPAGLLSTEEQTGKQRNRSFTYPEAEMFRAANAIFRRHPEIPWEQYSRMLRGGAMDRLLLGRTPPVEEQAVVPPRWAVDRALAWAEEHRAALAASAVTVVGSLDNLVLDIPDAPAQLVAPDRVGAEVAAEAMVGVFSSAVGRGPLLRGGQRVRVRKGAPAVPHKQGLRGRTSGAVARTRAHSTGDLMLALAGRLLTRRRSRRP
jgi:hypothetical protein